MKYLSLIEDFDLDATGLHPFLFQASGEPQTEVPEMEENVLAAPFPYFSIEMEGKNVLTSLNGDHKIIAMVVKELSPGSYHFWLRFERKGAPNGRFYFEASSRSLKSLAIVNGERQVKDMTEHFGESYLIEAQSAYLSIVEAFISRLHTKKLGVTRGVGFVRYKNAAGQKKKHVPREVIYVSNVSKKSQPPATSRPVNWSHSWDVAAHWRRLKNPESLGKDRAGNRVVKGFTFIGNYAKGEGRELITKTRKVR